MVPETNDMDPAALQKARQIPKWVGRYADNRNVPYFFVRMGFFLLAFALIAGSSKLAGRAAQEGYRTAALAFCVLSVASAVLWIWLILTRRLVPLIQELAGRFYGAEGMAVAMAEPDRSSLSKSTVGVAFAICVVFTVAAGFFLLIPHRYLLALTAAYAVPFLLYRIWARRKTSPFMLLWPGLLAAHAFLSLAGVRPFNNEIGILTFLAPVLGYGAIAGLASHLYGRVALHKLRNLTQPTDSSHPGRGQNA